MRKEYYSRSVSQEEVIALFGQARLVKTIDNKLEVRGGTLEEQAQAREWQATFLTNPITEQRPPRLTNFRAIPAPAAHHPTK